MGKIIAFLFGQLSPMVKITPVLAVCLSWPISALSQDADRTKADIPHTSLVIIDPSGTEHELTDHDFAELPWKTLVTHTAWTEGPRSFEGVLVRDVLSTVGIGYDSQNVRPVLAIALNDYRISIPMSDFFEFDVMIARKMDGKPMTRRDKGPYWIVYPRDQNTDLAEPHYDHRWVWQLWRLQVQ